MASINKLLERLNQAIDVIDNPKKAGKTTDIETLFWQTLFLITMIISINTTPRWNQQTAHGATKERVRGYRFKKAVS